MYCQRFKVGSSNNEYSGNEMSSTTCKRDTAWDCHYDRDDINMRMTSTLDNIIMYICT